MQHAANNILENSRYRPGKPGKIRAYRFCECATTLESNASLFEDIEIALYVTSTES